MIGTDSFLYLRNFWTPQFIIIWLTHLYIFPSEFLSGNISSISAQLLDIHAVEIDFLKFLCFFQYCPKVGSLTAKSGAISDGISTARLFLHIWNALKTFFSSARRCGIKYPLLSYLIYSDVIIVMMKFSVIVFDDLAGNAKIYANAASIRPCIHWIFRLSRIS